MIINNSCRILWHSITYTGRNHDKKLADEAPLEAFTGEMLADSGFQGLQKRYGNIKLPYKKPPKGELAEELKQFNKELASERVKIEHVFARLKTFRIIGEICRCRRLGFLDRVWNVVCALYNFKISQRLN